MGENERGLMSAGKIINIGFIQVFVLIQQPRLLAKDRECPQALANPRKSQNKSNEYTSKKKSVKKSNPLYTLFE